MSSLSKTAEVSVMSYLLNNGQLGTVGVYDSIFTAFNYTQAPSPVPPLWLSLHTGNPGETGASEATTSGYARASYARDQVTVSSTNLLPWSSSTITTGGANITRFSNNLAVNWPTLGGSDTYTHWGAWTASTSGVYICGGPIVVADTVPDVGYATTTTRIYCRAHGLAGGELIRLYTPYNNVASIGGSALALSAEGETREVAAIADPDYFDVVVALSSTGPVIFFEYSTLAVAAGSVPNVAAAALRIFVS